MITKYARLLTRLDRLPAADRKAAEKALRRIKTRKPSRTAALDIVADMVQAATRTHAKRAQDAASDHARRCLIGARLPREEVDRYRTAAAKEGVSLYRWTAYALQSAYQRHEAIYGRADSEDSKTLRQL